MRLLMRETGRTSRVEFNRPRQGFNRDGQGQGGERPGYNREGGDHTGGGYRGPTPASRPYRERFNNGEPPRGKVAANRNLPRRRRAPSRLPATIERARAR